VRVDPRWQRRAADALARHGWRVQRTVDGRPNPAHVWDEDDDFARRYAAVRGLTLVTPPAAYVLFGLAQQALSVPGEFAEVGVYQGGTARLLAGLVAASRRPLHLFDTFAGMPPTDASRDLHREGDFADTSLAGVAALLADSPSALLHQGFFPSTAAGLEDRVFAFVHVDVDIHRSVLDACDFFYRRLSAGGFLLFDDYGWTSCPGARAAVDEFFADKAERPLYLPTGQALVVRLAH
jgi:O-methyltransferase